MSIAIVRPVQRVLVLRDRRAEADLDPGADRELDRRHLDDRGRAVVLGAQLDPAVAGGDDKGAVRCEHAASDHAQAVAERATGRQPQQLGRDHRPVDARTAGRSLPASPSMPGPSSSTK